MSEVRPPLSQKEERGTALEPNGPSKSNLVRKYPMRLCAFSVLNVSGNIGEIYFWTNTSSDVIATRFLFFIRRFCSNSQFLNYSNKF